MSKNLKFTIELEFSEKIISDADILEVAQNIANALVHEANTKGIAPEGGDAFTKLILVTPQYLNKTITEEV